MVTTSQLFPQGQVVSHTLKDDAISLLRCLIETPSFSTKEDKTAQIIADFLQNAGIVFERNLHNVVAKNAHFDPDLPTLLLNSHHDTVVPNKAYTRDPFQACVEEGKLFGLGSNDAGGCLVGLIAAFVHFYQRSDLPFNLILAATAEEENSGENGLELVYPEMENVAWAIVGEPTQMNAAIAERGLLVLECKTTGISAHAAHTIGVNAIDLAMQDIQWFHQTNLPKTSPLLGDVKMSVTKINAGYLHNMIPDECFYTVDIRTTDAYRNKEVVSFVTEHIKADIVEKMDKLEASGIPEDHPLVDAARQAGAQTYASNATSDQAVLLCPSIKMGPGDSARSHTADEFIFVSEVRDGIEGYVSVIENFAHLQKR